MTNTKTVDLYNGAVKLVFYPDSHRYKIEGSKEWIRSVTAITGNLDKSRFLLPWAVNLTITKARELLENAPQKTFTREDLESVFTEAAREYEKKRDKAATVGHIVHAYAEAFGQEQIKSTHEYPLVEQFLERQKEDPLNAPVIEQQGEQIVNGIRSFLNWVEDVKPKIVETERFVYSRNANYAGLLDAIAEISGERYLIDYKTGKAIYNEMRYQLAGYYNAYMEEMEESNPLHGAMIIHFNKDTGECTSKPSEHIQDDVAAFHALAAVDAHKRLMSKE